MITIAAGPLPADAVAGHEKLYSESQTLGPGDRPRLIDEGGVGFGHLTVYPLALDDLPALTRRRPDINGLAFDIVEFPFDLDPLPGSRRYVQADYVVTLDTPGVIARSLWPDTVSTPIDVERSRTFSVDVDLTFVGVPGAPGVETGRVFRYQELQPVITTRGRGTGCFGWTFLAATGQPLLSTSRTVFAVIERPKTTATLTGSLFVTAHVRGRTLPSVGPRLARTRIRPFRLNTTDGSFVLDAAA
ncbi:hypothetical protein Q0Z83_048080 [Actinoplanes sichuanensis]|uniref:Acetoacetate decarboxylase n=1 Tax=Actinoplanes sichuanensis TaxID=512349 RepID=A0ABW4AQC8_9ACTN|nr:hypothetical protein [Actinoplanes sichuanensis]BEL06617.1 hypothetical protein Q0Z83_048080 [Actinoplanes sichuanensis]